MWSRTKLHICECANVDPRRDLISGNFVDRGGRSFACKLCGRCEEDPPRSIRGPLCTPPIKQGGGIRKVCIPMQRMLVGGKEGVRALGKSAAGTSGKGGLGCALTDHRWPWVGATGGGGKKIHGRSSFPSPGGGESLGLGEEEGGNIRGTFFGRGQNCAFLRF